MTAATAVKIKPLSFIIIAYLIVRIVFTLSLATDKDTNLSPHLQ
jgi:uncharacterized membrane protein YhdT